MADDEDEITMHPSEQAAIAAAIEASEPGDIVEIHDVTCKQRPTDPDDRNCTCVPIVVVVNGERA